MRALSLWLILAALPSFAQVITPYTPELLEVALEGKEIVDTVQVLRNGAAVYPQNNHYVLRLTRNEEFPIDQTYFVTVLDIQPNGVVEQLYPSPIKASDFIRITDDSPLELRIDSRSLKFEPPYGKEQFLVLFSRRPLIYYTLRSYAGDPAVRVLKREEVDWIIAGIPPVDLENELLAYPLLFELRPELSKQLETNVNKREDESIDPDRDRIDHPLDRDSTMASRMDSGRVVERYLVSNSDLYTLFPILTFIQPAEPSYEPGIRALRVHAVNHRAQSFTVTGNLSCGRRIDRMEFKVESMNEQGVAARSYTLREFRKAPMSMLFAQPVTLFNGKNRVSVIAYTSDGYGVRQELYVNCDTEQEVRKGADHLLILAVDRYASWDPLRNAVNDADSIRSVLQRNYGISTEHTHRLANEECTKRAIDSVFRYLITTLKDQDRLIVYFAGHGYFDTLIDEGYWIPVDAQRQQWNTSSYLSNSTISKYMASLPTRHTLFISDACFSGSYCISDNRGAHGYLERMDHARSRWIFSSGRMEVVADDYKGSGHSPFAYFILKYLRSPDEDAFSTSELAAYVTKGVANNSEQTPLARPVRNSGDEGGEYVFIRVEK